MKSLRLKLQLLKIATSLEILLALKLFNPKPMSLQKSGPALCSDFFQPPQLSSNAKKTKKNFVNNVRLVSLQKKKKSIATTIPNQKQVNKSASKRK